MVVRISAARASPGPSSPRRAVAASGACKADPRGARGQPRCPPRLPGISASRATNSTRPWARPCFHGEDSQGCRGFGRAGAAAASPGAPDRQPLHQVVFIAAHVRFEAPTALRTRNNPQVETLTAPGGPWPGRVLPQQEVAGLGLAASGPYQPTKYWRCDRSGSDHPGRRLAVSRARATKKSSGASRCSARQESHRRPGNPSPGPSRRGAPASSPQPPAPWTARRQAAPFPPVEAGYASWPPVACAGSLRPGQIERRRAPAGNPAVRKPIVRSQTPGATGLHQPRRHQQHTAAAEAPALAQAAYPPARRRRTDGPP